MLLFMLRNSWLWRTYIYLYCRMRTRILFIRWQLRCVCIGNTQYTCISWGSYTLEENHIKKLTLVPVHSEFDTRIDYSAMSTIQSGVSREEQYNRHLYSECSGEPGSEVYDKPDKRTRHLIKEWDEFHMLVAILSSKRSWDPNRQVP